MLVHGFVPVSRANGPGRRAVLWFQGCTLNCPECWNQASHPFEGAPTTTTEVTSSDASLPCTTRGDRGFDVFGRRADAAGKFGA
jgi:anaerobic ribonucleoside-triphosphate reductase activating protein